MNITNEDLKLLYKIEIELWNNNSGTYHELWKLIEKLENKKEEKNKKNWNKIKEKRKIDKYYAREKTRKEKARKNNKTKKGGF